MPSIIAIGGIFILIFKKRKVREHEKVYWNKSS
nr:MAG TPA: Cell-membrane associated Mucin15 [Caudoviricetes sp.]